MESQLSLRVPAHLSVKIRQKAKNLGLKRSDVIRMALSRFFEEDEVQDEGPVYDRVRHLVGAVKTGISDLGERHREHLLRKLKKRV